MYPKAMEPQKEKTCPTSSNTSIYGNHWIRRAMTDYTPYGQDKRFGYAIEV
jgi:hypothetical protein